MLAAVTPQERKLRLWVKRTVKRIEAERKDAKNRAEFNYHSGYLKALERVLKRLDD